MTENDEDVPTIEVDLEYEGDNVVPFPGGWHGRISPEAIYSKVRKKVAQGLYKDIVIVTEDQEGEINVTSSSHRNENILWLLEQAKLHILGVPEQDDDPEDLRA